MESDRLFHLKEARLQFSRISQSLQVEEVLFFR